MILSPTVSEVVGRLSRRTSPSRTENQTTGGSKSLALFRLTAGVIRLLTRWVAVPLSVCLFVTLHSALAVT